MILRVLPRARRTAPPPTSKRNSCRVTMRMTHPHP
ncbi:hypothetical protein GZL_02947 [Streptomyces sp. 769]|nr:hypothetical protein GZL_02947 [Streptomyces sp. 769]